MRWTLLKTGLRDAMRRPWLSALMIFSVALGVAVVVAIDLANDSAARAFHLSTEAVIGRATHVVQGGPTGVDEDLYRRLRVESGYRLSAPIVEGYAGVEEMGGQTVHVLGVDPLAEAPFRSYLTTGASAPAGTNGGVEALAAFYTQRGGVFIGADSAARFGLKPGDHLTLRVDSARRTAVIVGLLQPPNDVSARALEGLMLADISSAQELFGMPGKLSRVDLIASPAGAAAIAGQLPPGVTLASASEQAETVTQLTAAFQLNLTAFSLLALLVGMFLIYNTVMFTVVQRRPVLGILRCLGVTGRQTFALIMAEAVLMGAVGSALGMLLGIFLGRFTVALVTQTINDLYFSVSVRGVDVQVPTLIKGAALGVSAAMIAAAIPAAEAAAVPPVTALQRSDLEDRVRKLLPGLTGAGIVMALAGIALIVLVQSSVVASFAGLFIFLFGLIFCVPLLTIYLMRLAAWLLGRWGVSGRMAARTVTNALSRTSIAIAALMVAVSVTIGVTVMISSFRATVENWLDQTLLADIYISPPQSDASRAALMDPALPERIAAVPGVSGIEIYRNVTVASPTLGPVRVNAVTSRRGRGEAVYRFRDGSPEQIWTQVQAGALIITEPFANRHHLTLGDRVTLMTDHGPRDFPVAAVSYDYSSDQGSVLMSLEKYRSLWNDDAISSVAAYVEPGADAGRTEDAVRGALGGALVRVQANRALRQTALVIFDRTFAITAALRVIAVVVAFIGVLSALMALQLERTRELGTLRASGMTLPQLWRLTLLETGLMGAAAGVLSMPVGLAMSLVLIYVINLRSFGWTIFFSPVPEVYAQAFAISVAAALLAAIYPMQRMGRMQVAAALRSE